MNQLLNTIYTDDYVSKYDWLNIILRYFLLNILYIINIIYFDDNRN